MYFNYKLFYSVVLQAVADANYRFLFVEVGAYGKQSDAGVFEASNLSKFVANENNFPPDRTIVGLSIPLPYLLVVDDAYPLRRNMMKPFSHRSMSPEEQIFNGRLSRARRCVECSFGILCNKWRLLLKAIETNENKACDIVKCLTVLHNVVIDKEGMDHHLLETVKKKVEDNEVKKLRGLRTGRKYNHRATEPLCIRECLMKYFNSAEGSVPWQDRYLKTV